MIGLQATNDMPKTTITAVNPPMSRRKPAATGPKNMPVENANIMHHFTHLR